ncbi:MAG: DUF4392 domain-containing protein [Chloroflexi bacterium]|nr:DUF4392 domain-containing protein [Chloroflexota bacterium]
MGAIEEIILRGDVRGMRHLAPHLEPDYVTDCAQFVMDHKGRVIITTGFYILSAGQPETDGPPGAVAIGNALDELGFDVSYVTDSVSLSALASIVSPGHAIIEFPITSHRESSDFAQELIRNERPDLMISIERAGISSDGIYRNMRGMDISDHNAKIDHLFDQNPYSLGIGDGGNEIGMGNLAKIIAETEGLPDVPAVTTTTNLICAAVSNWGGYGLVTALSQAAGRNLLPSLDDEVDWVNTLVEGGAVDGFSGDNKAYVDGFTLEENAKCLTDLHKLLA